jgi:hypothetical protein
MIWIILIIVIGFILIRFFISLNKDNEDLQVKPLSEKFEIIVNTLNDSAFHGKGNITTIDNRRFNLYQDGQNQIINFDYSTGHLTIIWKYKYFQKELIHERQFRDVRNVSLFEQQKIAETIIREMDSIIENHKKLVLKDAPKPEIITEEVHIKALKEGLETSLRDLMTKSLRDTQQQHELIQRSTFLNVARDFSERVKEEYSGFKQDSEKRNHNFLDETDFNNMIDEITIKLMREFTEQKKL